MAPVKRPIASVPEDDSDLEEDGSSLGSNSSQTIPVSLVTFYAAELMRLTLRRGREEGRRAKLLPARTAREMNGPTPKQTPMMRKHMSLWQRKLSMRGRLPNKETSPPSVESLRKSMWRIL